jgi:hypothetical protein
LGVNLRPANEADNLSAICGLILEIAEVSVPYNPMGICGLVQDGI